MAAELNINQASYQLKQPYITQTAIKETQFLTNYLKVYTSCTVVDTYKCIWTFLVEETSKNHWWPNGFVSLKQRLRVYF